MVLCLEGRALHFVFKIGDRKATTEFYKNVLGMQPLRHEEFTEGCEAACNGPYANRWSKTMFGYGPEDNHFVIELTYNYPVKSYQMGNDFLGITIQSKDILKKAKAKNVKVEELDGKFVIQAPGGYKYHIINEEQPKDKDPIQKVTLASSDLKRTTQYWNGVLGLRVFNETPMSASFAFDENQCMLEFIDIGKPIEHAMAYGRIAFSVPKASLPLIEETIKKKNHKVLKSMVSLETPGKATVTVVILADPDDHEICFVDDEGFRELSKVDPKADKDLAKCIKHDKS